jgi:hypothetical protein
MPDFGLGFQVNVRNLHLLVYLVIYDSGWVSLEHLLHSWYPSQVTICLFPVFDHVLFVVFVKCLGVVTPRHLPSMFDRFVFLPAVSFFDTLCDLQGASHPGRLLGVVALSPDPCRGTSLIRNSLPPRATVGPWA